MGNFSVSVLRTDYKIVPVGQLAAHAKSSTLYGQSYGRTSKFFRLDGLLLFCIIMGLRELRYRETSSCASRTC